MISRKTTIDSTVRYIPKIEEPQERENKPKTTNNRKQDKKIHKTIRRRLTMS